MKKRLFSEFTNDDEEEQLPKKKLKWKKIVDDDDMNSVIIEVLNIRDLLSLNSLLRMNSGAIPKSRKN